MRDTVYFRVLGPLDAEIDGRSVVLGPARTRTVLALLLMRANTVCPTDCLIDDLWGGSPPATARVQIQSQICALRQTLGEARDRSSVLVTRSPGYLLRVEPTALDLHRFRAEVTAGREKRRHGDAVGAAAAFRAALDVWRGPALCDITLDAVRGFATHLDETRVDALEDWSEMALMVGGSEAVAAETAEMVARYPLRERLRASLMRALAATGRTAEALEIYHEGRAALVEELGIEPGADLTNAHRDVLSHSPPGARHGTAVPGPPVGAPAVESVPPDLDDFSGRGTAVDEGARVLRDRSPHAPAILAVSGPAGIGKTSLAVHLAHATRDAYPGGRLLVRLDADDRGPGAALASCLYGLGVPRRSIPRQAADRAGLLRTRLRGRAVLFVLDDVTHEAQVRTLTAIEGCCGFVLTSRRRLSGLDGVHHLELSPMPHGEGVELLKRSVGRTRLDAQPQETTTLVRYCDGLPLALRICAARLSARPEWTVADLVGKLTAEHTRLDWLEAGDRAVRTALDTTYRQIGELHQRLFRLLGLLDAPSFPSWVAAAVLDQEPAHCDRILEDLVDVRLVEPAGRGPTGPRYRMHDLVRLFARERCVAQDPPARRRRALGNAFDGWLVLAQQVDEVWPGKNVFDPEPTPTWRPPPSVIRAARAHATEWRESEHRCLTAAVRTAARLGMSDAAWPLAQRVSTYLDITGQLEWWHAVLQHALDACEQAGNARGTACMLRHMSETHAIGGRPDEALDAADRARRIYDRFHPEWGVATLGPRIAFTHRARGESAQARGCAENAVRAASGTGDSRARGRALSCLALLLMDGGDFDSAHRLAGQAQNAFADAGARAGMAEALALRGELARRTGDFPAAEAALARATGDAEAIGDDGLRGMCVLYLARLRLDCGRAQDAVTLARNARDTHRRSGERYTEALSLATLGEATHLAHGPVAAVPVLTEALTALRAVEAVSQVRRVLTLLVDACSAAGDVQAARRHRADLESYDGSAAPPAGAVDAARDGREDR